MQKFHPVLAWLLLLLLIVHLILGSVTLLTPVFLLQTQFAWVFLGFAAVHVLLSLGKLVGKSWTRGRFLYLRENRSSWFRLLSGLAVLVLALVHRTLWTMQTPFGVLLRSFEWPSLLAQLLFVAALAAHILLNIRPLLIDSALDPAGRAGRWMRRVTVALAVLAAAAALVYFVRGML